MGGRRTSTQTQTSSTSPWQPQADQLQYIFGQARSAYDAANANPGYQGDFIAQANSTQRAALDSLMASSGNLGNLGASFQNTGTGLMSGFSGAQGVANNLAGGDAVARRVGRMALADPTQGILASANEYANNPYLDGVINAASRDVTRNLTEQQLPSLNLAATGSGNMNSSRAGAAEAVLMRGAQDRIADIASNIRGNAFQNGLNLASQNRQFGLNTALGASAQNLGTMAQGGQMLAGLGEAGANLATTGANMGVQGGQLALGVGDTQQGYDQQRLDNDMARFNYADQRPWENMGRFMGIVGSNNWGQQSTQTTTQRTSGPSALQTALGIGSLVAAPFTGGSSLAGMAAGGMSALGSLFGGGGGGTWGFGSGQINPNTGIYRGSGLGW